MPPPLVVPYNSPPAPWTSGILAGWEPSLPLKLSNGVKVCADDPATPARNASTTGNFDATQRHSVEAILAMIARGRALRAAGAPCAPGPGDGGRGMGFSSGAIEAYVVGFKRGRRVLGGRGLCAAGCVGRCFTGDSGFRVVRRDSCGVPGGVVGGVVKDRGLGLLTGICGGGSAEGALRHHIVRR